MGAPNYTYTITNGTAADASQVMQNFNDILNGVTDGTDDLSISALTCAGAATLNGNVTLGNAAGDDITISGSIAASIPIKTQYAVDLGTTTIGIKSIYFGSSDAAAKGTRLIGATVASDWALTLPTGVPSVSGSVLTSTTGGVTSWRVSPLVDSSQVICDSPNGHGSTNTVIRRWTNSTTTGTDVTYADSAGNGATFTINTAGIYAISYSDGRGAAVAEIGISLNSAQLTTSIVTITTANRLQCTTTISGNRGSISTVARLAASDVIRCHTDGTPDNTGATNQFRIVRIA
jgi:hypothetical protein